MCTTHGEGSAAAALQNLIGSGEVLEGKHAWGPYRKKPIMNTEAHWPHTMLGGVSLKARSIAATPTVYPITTCIPSPRDQLLRMDAKRAILESRSF